MNKKDVENKMRGIVAEKFGVDPESFNRDTDMLDGIGMDSLDFIELIMEAEHEFNIAIPDEAVEDTRTFGALCDVVCELAHVTE